MSRDTNFYPESILLDTVYIPTFADPQRIDITLDKLTVEEDVNGLQSIIKLEDETGNIIPFIDFSKFDPESKDWYYFDDGYDFPCYLTYKDGMGPHGWAGYWQMHSINKLPNDTYFQGSKYTRASFDDLDFNKSSRRFYFSKAGVRTEASDGNFIFYKFNPIIITLNGIPLKDITDYTSFGTLRQLTNTNIDINPEFYYDFQSRLFTNQNLLSYNPKDIIVTIYKNISSVSVKCRMAANNGSTPYFTPTVDYYVLKLKGQYLKG